MDPEMLRRSRLMVLSAEEEIAFDASSAYPPYVPKKEEGWKHSITDETGSEERFHGRVATYDKKRMPRVSHHFWWLVHNCVAHPLIGVAPLKRFFDFHDWTSKKINGE